MGAGLRDLLRCECITSTCLTPYQSAAEPVPSPPVSALLAGAVLLWISDEKLVLCSRIKRFTGIKTFSDSWVAFTCLLCNRTLRREQVRLALRMPLPHSQVL